MQERGKSQVLRRTAIFGDLSDAEIAELETIAIERRLKTGEFAYQDGDDASRFYIIDQGKVKLIKHSSGGGEFIIAFLGPDEVFGVVAALIDKPYPCSAVAADETSVVEFDKKDFLPFLHKHPKIALGIIKVLGERLIDAQNRLRDLAGERVEQRLLKTLLRLHSNHGSELPFTRQEIADMTGTTTETVIRVFSHLKDSNIIESVRGKIIIVDDVKLRQLCNEIPPV